MHNQPPGYPLVIWQYLQTLGSALHLSQYFLPENLLNLNRTRQYLNSVIHHFYVRAQRLQRNKEWLGRSLLGFRTSRLSCRQCLPLKSSLCNRLFGCRPLNNSQQLRYIHLVTKTTNHVHISQANRFFRLHFLAPSRLQHQLCSALRKVFLPFLARWLQST